MSDQPSFPNAPNATHEFQRAGEPSMPSEEHSRDPVEPERLHDEPSEYQVERHLTPGGEIEQIVHTQLDQQRRANIHEAQQRFRDGLDEHGNALDIDQVPGAGEEYEKFLNSPESPDQFRDRMRDQFRDNAERQIDHER